MTAVVFAPNWLGDVVMALPALADLRRHLGDARLVVAARRSVAPLFGLVPGLETVALPGLPSGLASAARAIRADADAVRPLGASLAVVLPNSIRAAAVAWTAGVPARWGYHRDLRGVLLTHPVRRPAAHTHQVDAYRQLVAAQGVANGPREPVLEPPEAMVDAARALIEGEGWDGRALVGVAPGAAGGSAKRWPVDRVAAVVSSLVYDRDAACVLVGADGDRGAAAQVLAEAGRINGPIARGRLVDLTGRTTLPHLAGLLRLCRAFVSNDSGAMHLAAAVGTPLVAVFGPTNERATAPVPRPAGAAAIVAGSAWCRPCRFRDCPLDHRCMTSIPAARVFEAVSERL